MIAIAAATLACGSGAMYREQRLDQPVPTASGPPPPLADDPHTTVEHLSTDLDSRRDALGLSRPQVKAIDACEPVCAIDVPPDLPTHDHLCVVGEGSACAANCVQADGACDDAAKICDIAKKDSIEAWLATRCREATATCLDARPKCCGCGS